MPSSAKHEVWVYDRVNAARKKITDTAGAAPCSSTSYRPNITSLLQEYWGATGSSSTRSNTSGFDLSVADASGMSSSCQFLAAAGLQLGGNFIEPQTPSISKDGRFVAFVTDFDAETLARVSGSTTHEATRTSTRSKLRCCSKGKITPSAASTSAWVKRVEGGGVGWLNQPRRQCLAEQ